MIKDFVVLVVEIECFMNVVCVGDCFVCFGIEDIFFVAISRNFCVGKVRGLLVRVVYCCVVEICV